MPQTHYLNLIRRQQQLLPCVIFHFNPESRDVQAWFWPVTQAGARVAPSDFLTYRAVHKFKTPCCPCAAIEGSYTESALYLAPQGPYVGEYVAGCAFERCGYIICIERLYTRRGLLIERYPVREAGHPPPPPVHYVPGGAPGGAQHVEGLSVARCFNALWVSLPTYERPASSRQNARDRLLKLDSSGLSEMKFRKLFARCRCGLVTTRRAFSEHVCAPAAIPTIIDLTLDGGDGTEPAIIDLTQDSDNDL